MGFLKESKYNILYYTPSIILSAVLLIACINCTLSVTTLILMIVSSLVLLLTVLKFMNVLRISRKAYNSQHSYKKLHAVEEITGTPGTGKTTLTVVLVYLESLNMAKKLDEENYVNECRALRKNWLNNSLFLEDLCETRYAKRFFENSPYAPHVFSNQSMKIKGKHVHLYTQEHSLGIKKVPPSSIEYGEEASGIYPTTTHADRVSEWLIDNRFKRHQKKESYLVEQETENINKDVRRVVGATMELEERATLLQPIFAIKLRNLAIQVGMKFNIQKGWYTAFFLDFLGKVIQKVGVIKWTYYTMRGSESKIASAPKKQAFYAYCDLPIEFDSRSFRNVPKTRDLEGEPIVEGYDSLVIKGNSVEAELIRTAFENIKKKEEKN